MIPIKNPNISTNRYKQLLWYEKNYKEINNEYFDLVKEWQKCSEENWVLEITIENAIEEINCLYEKGKISKEIKTFLVKTLAITKDGGKKDKEK